MAGTIQCAGMLEKSATIYFLLKLREDRNYTLVYFKRHFAELVIIIFQFIMYINAVFVYPSYCSCVRKIVNFIK